MDQLRQVSVCPSAGSEIRFKIEYRMAGYEMFDQMTASIQESQSASAAAYPSEQKVE